MLKIVLDNRETKLKELFLNDIDTTCEVQTLLCGDIHFVCNDKVIFVFERKTISDLASSIIDGRYKQQKQNMLLQYDRTKCFYIIEEFNFSLINDMVYGAIINTITRDKINMIYTQNIKDTLKFCKYLYKKMKTNPNDYNNDNLSFVSQDIVYTHKKVRDKNVLYLEQLCCIPSISMQTAKAIQTKYPSMFHLYSNLSSLSHDEKIIKLSSIVTTDKNGKIRHISNTCINNIINMLFV